MSKFSKGDKARVISIDSDDVDKGISVNDIVTVDESGTSVPFVILKNGHRTPLMERQLEHFTEHSKEITINGATYVLKEEPKPEHEWKFGDIAVHEEYGVGVVCCVAYASNELLFAHKVDCDWIDAKNITFLRRADLSV